MSGYKEGISPAELAARQAVVAEAMTWQGTKYHHMGRIKIKRNEAGAVIDQGGTDCAQSIYMILRNQELIPEMPLEYYPPDWHYHRDLEKYLGAVLEFTHEITEADAQPGDIVLYKFGQVMSHGAMIIEPGWPNIIHALKQSQRMLRDIGNVNDWGRRPRRFFSIW